MGEKMMNTSDTSTTAWGELVPFRVNPDAAAYIRGGHTPDSRSVNVDLKALSQESRELLAEYYTGWPIRTGHMEAGKNVVTVAAPTVEALIEALRKSRADEAERAAAQERARAELLAEAHRVIAERETVSRDASTWPTYPQLVPNWPRGIGCGLSAVYTVEQVIEGTDGAQWLEELRVENERRQQAVKDARKVEAAARYAAKVEAEAPLRAWVAENGSRRVKLLIEEEHRAWLPVAETEYLDANTPAGYAAAPTETVDEAGERVPVTCVDMKDRTKPREEDIEALRDARRLVASASDSVGRSMLSDPQMGYLKIYRAGRADEERDADGDVVAEEWPVVRVTVGTSTGRTRDVYARTGTER